MNTSQPDVSKANLLVVDDIPANLRLLTEMLTKHNYTVRPVSEGFRALTAIRTKLPDLILLDIMMPNMNGYEVCKQLKADTRTRDIPIIFLSALNEVLDKVEAFSVGGVDFISKPFQVEEVLARVETHLTLRRLQKRLQTQNDQLQHEIAERQQVEKALRQKNEKLANTLQQLKTTQKELIQAEKMAALGQLVAGVAHEINTPLGAIQLSVDNISAFLSETLTQLPVFFQSLPETQQHDFFALLQKSLQNEMTLSAREQRRLRKLLIPQLEKYGIDNATNIADTLVEMGINEDIDHFSSLLTAENYKIILDIAYQLVSLQQSTQTIASASQRAAKVVFALKSFARFDHTSERVEANIQESIEIVLTLYHNKFKHGIEVNRFYDNDIPLISCYPDELNQVWTNIIHNALQAMDYQGTLNIAITRQENYLLISFTDSGKGIEDDIKSKIFEPFFTTKARGEGSGLGLDIVKKIIDKHEGKIEVESVPSKTTFTVFLPVLLKSGNEILLNNYEIE
ncbi:response regulator [Candidatus Parabeggiatoa sp. HSG14]|uniref:hybrid sensor histidine kinase/response regulator n=1 Tax=Candidatus Parabeggiatoa sp. HSG14 TaxID=3055593 RepID=UPI0025A7EBBF|nr:response regulator [Thiotrichales bacterium HSG14]